MKRIEAYFYFEMELHGESKACVTRVEQFTLFEEPELLKARLEEGLKKLSSSDLLLVKVVYGEVIFFFFRSKLPGTLACATLPRNSCALDPLFSAEHRVSIPSRMRGDQVVEWTHYFNEGWLVDPKVLLGDQVSSSQEKFWFQGIYYLDEFCVANVEPL